VRESYHRCVVRFEVWLVEAKKVFREWLHVVGPLAKVKVSPRFHLRGVDAVVPGEEWDDPDVIEVEWFCRYT